MLFVFCTAASAQHDSQFTQYMSSNVLYNPARAGVGEKLQGLFIQRFQYVGLDGAPRTWALSVSTPFQIADTKHGVSLSVLSDKIGDFDNMMLNVGYAYRHEMHTGILSGGLSLGMVVAQFDGGEWGLSDDPIIPQRAEDATNGFDFSLGGYYEAKEWYVGASCLHINEPRLFELGSSGEKVSRVKRSFFFDGGHDWRTPIDDLTLNTNALIVFNSVKPQFTLGAICLYKERYWGGLSYRIKDALGAMLGMSVGRDFRLGIAYEYSLSRLIGINNGSFEFFVSYAFKMKFTRKEKKYKSLRFL
ncbi:MAG: PorP/SprF family type IX secretion system membrane protein [Bacteroidales bacterium]